MMWFDRMTGVSDRLFYLRPRFRETSGKVIVTGLFTFGGGRVYLISNTVSTWKRRKFE